MKSKKLHQRGIALVLTIAILALTLVLVVGFAKLTRIESMASANFNGYIVSKYAAQGALNRAIAEIAYRYKTDPSKLDNGISTFYSNVQTNGNDINYRDTGTQTLRGVATDLETVFRYNSTGLNYTKPGKDGKVDYIPTASQNNSPEFISQWIGITNSEGLLIAREAYLVTAGGVNINCAGNFVQNSNPATGIDINSRNEGYSTSEINLVAAFMALNPTTWNYTTAKYDVEQILRYRYGSDGLPGAGSPTSFDLATYLEDGRDNNGDGSIDNVSDGGGNPGGIPQLSLEGSDGRNVKTIIHANPDNDKLIQDLTKLKTDDQILTDINSRTRIDNNFLDIQLRFVTQSPSPIDYDLLNLNNTNDNAYGFLDDNLHQSRFFGDIIAKCRYLWFPTGNQFYQQKVAANIVTYASPTNMPPFSTNFPINNLNSTTNTVGEAAAPLINQIKFDFTPEISAIQDTDLTTGERRILVTLTDIKAKTTVEFWHPYTNAFFNFDPEIGNPPSVEITNTQPIAVLHGTSIYSVYNPTHLSYNLAFPESDFPGNHTTAPFIDAIPFGPGIIKSTGTDKRFFTVSNDPIAGTSLLNGPAPTWTIHNVPDYNDAATWDASGIENIIISNINFWVKLKTHAGSDGKLIDVANPTVTTNNLLIGITAITNAAMQSLNDTTPGTPIQIPYTASFALDDPRQKDWQAEYIGSLTPNCTSIGTTNFTVIQDFTINPNSQLTEGGYLYRPHLRGEDRTYIFFDPITGFHPEIRGIGPKTFYVKNRRFFSSPVELGRIHRSLAWQTIDFKGGSTSGDSAMLNFFTTIGRGGNWGGGQVTYHHGAINLNTKPDNIPAWAALFTGMPWQTQAMLDRNIRPIYFDIYGSGNPVNVGGPTGEIDPNFPFSKAFGKIIGSRLGAFDHMGSITAITQFSRTFAAASPDSGLRSFGAPFNSTNHFTLNTDEDSEYLASHLFNLVSTQGQGNLFTIWAWGQSIRGQKASDNLDSTLNGTDGVNRSRFVDGETLIAAQVRPELRVDPDRPGKKLLDLKIIYYRFNPDLQPNTGF